MPARTWPGRSSQLAAVWMIGTLVVPCAHAWADPGRTSAPAERAPTARKPVTAPHAKHSDRIGRAVPASATIRLSRLNRDAARQAAGHRDGRDGTPRRIGLSRRPPGGAASCDAAGAWGRDDFGRTTWDLELEPSGANGIRLHLSRLELAPGSELAVADAGGRVLQRFRGGGAIGPRGCWTVPVPGEAVRLAYTAERGVTKRPVIVVDEVAHLYDQVPAADGDVGHDASAGGDGLLPCQQDVSCHPVDPNARDAVGRVLYTEPGLGTFVCSGVLLNDADPNTYAGYLLTANHCIADPAAAESAVVYWNYQTESCGGDAPPLEDVPVSVGGVLLATDEASDFTLLRLADDPAEGQGFAAWTTADPTGPVHGIHHPGGGIKRYSLGALTQNPPICDAFGLGLDHFWYLDWQLGMTEGGSSGSPLFNENWEVVGQLYGVCRYAGTTPGCDNPQDFNHLYGKFGVTFPAIAEHLLAVAPDDAYEDNDAPASAPPLAPGTHTLRLVDFDDYFRVEVDEPGTLDVTSTFDADAVDLGLELLAPDGSAIGTLTELPGAAAVRSGVLPGPYVVRVAKRHKWGGDYTLAIAVRGSTADFDGDGDVDLADFGHLQNCLTGGDIPQLDSGCLDARLDGDEDVDGDDLNLFSA